MLIANFVAVDDLMTWIAIFVGHLYSAGADGTLKVRLISDENHSSSGASYQEFANAQANKSVTFSLT